MIKTNTIAVILMGFFALPGNKRRRHETEENPEERT